MDERDREREVVGENEPPPPPRVERETTVIHTGGGGGGSGGMVAVIVVLVLAVVVLFFVFGGGLERAADETDINVTVDTPEINLPDIDIDRPEAPAQPAEGN